MSQIRVWNYCTRTRAQHFSVKNIEISGIGLRLGLVIGLVHLAIPVRA